MSIGQPLPRRDGPAKVTGQARYAADVLVPGMLYGHLVGAPVAAGRVRAIDTAAALGEGSALRVLTAADMPRFRPPPCLPVATVFLPLQDDEIRYQGQPVALVLAETLEAAEHAAALVRVACDPLPFAAETGGTDVTGARPPPDDTPYLFGTPARFEKGDVDAALKAAPIRQEATYVQPSRHHNPMETSTTLASWDGTDLVVHDAVQAGFTAQAALAAVLGLDPARVRVIAPHTGGGFGNKGLIWPHEILAAAAAMVVGRPVRVQLTRAQQYAMVGYQTRTVQTVTLGAEADGRLTALSQDSANLTSISEDYVELATEAGRSIYAAPNIRTTNRVLPRHVNLGTPMRSPVEGIGLWAVESAMNELAHRLDIDPLDLRLINYAEVDPADGRPWSSKKLRQAYEEGARLFGWRERPKTAARDGRWIVGQGMATSSMGCFRFPWKTRLTLRADGSALVEAGYHDIGTGSLTVIPQMAADALGIAASRVTTRAGDTLLPEAGPSYGSSATMGAGGAILDAADKIRRKLAALANLPVSETELRDGGVGRRGGAVQSYESLLGAAGFEQVAADGDWQPGYADRYAMRTFGAIFVEVGIDPELGLLRLMRAVGSYSAGRIINPRTARAQMVGGIVWGWGKAALEESRYEPRLGRWLGKNLSSVAVPVNADIPADITIHFVDEFDPYASPIGGKGIGELAPTGVDAAVADAVFHATGKRIRELPITSRKLLET